jgi:RNA polymerase sigma factor (sigma-70 family)
MTDEQLMQQVQEGDYTALGILMERHEARIFIRCKGILHNPEDAEEKVQDTFMRVVKYAKRYDPSKGSFLVWALKIAKNLCLDIKPKPPEDKADGKASESSHDESAKFMVDDKTIDKTQQCVEQLKPEDRDIIRLYYVLKHSVREVAHEIGKSKSAVHERLKKARAQIEACLEKKGIS